MGNFDIVIRNGRIIDGSGSPWFKGDVGIKGERISAIGDLGEFEAEREIDAKGLVVCPGFVDVHTHSDTSFLVNPKADSKVMQGVTTEIVGNCGGSAAPVTELGKSFSKKQYEDRGIDWDWTTIAEYLRRLETNGLPLNVGTLIGHGTVRASVMGYEAREPTPEELESMKELVDGGMREGAFGLSTGLKYTPGCYAKTEEIIELCKVIAKYGGIYATHQRTQGDTLIESTEESIKIGRMSRVPVQISHMKAKGQRNWGKPKNVLRIIDEARDSGVDIAFDQYPYIASGGSFLSMTPGWAREGGSERLLERLKDPEQRKEIEASILEHEDWIGPENLMISNFAPNRSYEGRTLDEIAKQRGEPPVSVVSDLLLEANGSVSIMKFSMWEKDVRDIMTHHAHIVGSDGSSLAPYGKLGEGRSHPRNYGCFTRFLGRYVLKERLLSIEDGIRRMTSFPAQRFGLRDRGILRANMFADVVVLDPKRVIDVATFEDSHRYSEGVEYVLVNGAVAVENGKFTGQLAGKALRHLNQTSNE